MNVHPRKSGFTLVEIIVSLAIFSVVAVIAIGALVRVTGANRQAQAIQSGVNNISFVLDAISREMRVGTAYQCFSGVSLTGDLVSTAGSSSCIDSFAVNGSESVPNDSLVAFISSGGLLYAYLFHQTGSVVTIYKGEQDPGDPTPTLSEISFNPATSQTVSITNYKVGVFGGSGRYQRLFLSLKGYVGTRITDQSTFNVQTTVSERVSS